MIFSLTPLVAMFQFFGTWQLLLCILLLGFIKPIDAKTTNQGVDYPDYPENGSGDPCVPIPDFNQNEPDNDAEMLKQFKEEKCKQHQERAHDIKL